MKSFCNEIFQHFNLNFPHNLHMNFIQLFIPCNMQLGIFLA